MKMENKLFIQWHVSIEGTATAYEGVGALVYPAFGLCFFSLVGTVGAKIGMFQVISRINKSNTRRHYSHEKFQ